MGGGRSMIDYNTLKFGSTIWQIDINDTEVMLRKIEVGHLQIIAGKYWISSEQEGSMDGIMLKADSHLLFDTKANALDYMSALWYSLKEAIKNETE
jgi:hypothetical protein